MKEYSTSIENIAIIRKMFHGYIFRRIEDNIGYVMCYTGQAERIQKHGIELTLIENAN